MGLIDRLKGVARSGMDLMQAATDNPKVKKIPVTNKFYKHVKEWQRIYQGAPLWQNIKYRVQGVEKTRTMLSMRMGKVVAHEMASLICNEKMGISFTDEEQSEYIEPILKQNDFDISLQDNIEYMFAAGGIAVEGYINDDDEIRLNYIQAKNFFPLTFDTTGNIKECAIRVEEKEFGTSIFTLIRRHEYQDGIYTISNELYQTVKGMGDLGKKIDLRSMYPDLEPVVELPDAARPFFAYCRPNIANNLDLDSPLGISIFANALDTLRVLDTIFDSLDREYNLGKKRIVVPASYLRTDFVDNSRRTYFDTEDEVFQGLGGMDDDKIHDISVQIRVQEHIEGINNALTILAAQTGFSAGTWSFTPSGLKTATEVISENSKTFKSKKSHEILIERFIQEIIEIIFAVGDAYLQTTYPDNIDIQVTFDDSISEDSSAILTEEVMKVSAQLQSKKRAIMKVNGVSEEEAAEILEEINAENVTPTPSVAELLGRDM